MIPETLAKFMLADTNVPPCTEGLATFDFGDGEVPAVFTTEGGIPEGAAYPAVHIAQVSGSSFGTRDKRGAAVVCRVSVYGVREPGSQVEAIARRIQRKLDRADIGPTLRAAGNAYGVWGCLAAWPVQTQDEQGFTGYTVAVNVRLLEQ